MVISSSAQTKREVRQIKVIIVLVLLISIAGAVAVFYYTKSSEQKEFENQFYDDANKVRVSNIGFISTYVQITVFYSTFLAYDR